MGRVRRPARREEITKRLGPRGPFLPMPHKAGRRANTKLTAKEWEEYRERLARHLREHPHYLVEMGQPTRVTTEKVWTLLVFAARRRPPLTELAFRASWLTDQEHEGLVLVAKQALVVALDYCICAGRGQKLVTFTGLFDALARRWSDHHRASGMRSVRDMRRETAIRCRRDLVVNGVKMTALWKVAVTSWSRKDGGNPFYQTERVPREGYRVVVKEGAGLRRVDQILEQDAVFARFRHGGLRLLFAKERTPERAPECRYAGERAYNVVLNGPLAEAVLKYQEAAELVFDYKTFRRDYERARTTLTTLRGELSETFGIDPDTSGAPVWLEEDPERRNANGYRRRRKKDGRSEVRTWSPRDRDLFYRSIEKGYEQGVQAGAVDLGEECRAELARAPEKWDRHLENFREWLKRRGRTLRGVSRKGVVKAALLTKTWRADARVRLMRYDRIARHLTLGREVFNQTTSKVLARRRVLDGLFSDEGAVRIHSGFYRIVNRRYQPTHFWPTYVTNRDTPASLLDEEAEAELGSFRKRWFKVWDGKTGELHELVGRDISSSQTQIIALLVGADDLLDQIMPGKLSVKEILAQWVWDEDERAPGTILRRGRKPYKGPEDKRLQNLVKDFWMQFFYGSGARDIVMAQWDDQETYGPGWAKIKQATAALKKQPGYAKMVAFLSACKAAAQTACAEDICAGVRLTDPLDGVDVRWNPVARAADEISSEGQKLIIYPPGFRGDSGEHRFKPSAPNHDGDYPVDHGELRRMVAPCLVHTLDAYFSSLVMAKLHEKGVRDFVGIHDCWLVPKEIRIGDEVIDGDVLLARVIAAASAEWYRGLGPVYENLMRYLKGHPKWGPFGRAIRAQWERRVGVERLPTFASRPA